MKVVLRLAGNSILRGSGMRVAIIQWEKTMKKAMIAAIALMCGTLFSLDWSQQKGVTLLLSPQSAQALIGAPRTPRSVAGVARRTTRRVVRRGYY
jgi:hypothetical protein